ncbi:MAG: hypothetical protein K0R34_4392 [Herbinix sp.]|jgi:hypothetical protein|nr:hypothetical protein [Herbinix sp.]
MSGLDKKQKKKYTVNNRLIMSLLLGLGFLSAILLVTMYITGEGSGRRSAINSSTEEETQGNVAEEPSGNEVLGVVTLIKEEMREITLYDVLKEESATFTYSGGTNVIDKYGQEIAISQLPIGTMVEAIHPEKVTKLSELKISTKAWEYVGVNNLGIDRSSRVMKITSNKYKYTDDIFILGGTDVISVLELAEMDELTVRGYEETIWSITVTRGHGTVKLEDYEGFLGDYITIGYETMQQIAEDMVIKVREGNFNLTVENKNYTAIKNITVLRNQETVVSLSDIGPDAAKQGLVTFEISPFGADLFVDGKLTTYAEALELTYGRHDVVVSLDGYITYEGKLSVDNAGTSIRIRLPEVSSNEQASVTETETGVGSGDSNNGAGNETDNDSTGTNNSDNGTTGDDTDNSSNEDYEVDDDHLIYVQNPIGASIYLNGEFQGVSPASFKKLIGTHVLTFIKEGYETTSYTVEVSDDNLDTYFNMPDLVKK